MDGLIEKIYSLGKLDRGCTRDCKAEVLLVVARRQMGGDTYRSTGRLMPKSSRLVWAYCCAECGCGSEIGEYTPELITCMGASLLIQGGNELPAIDRASERGVIIFFPRSERVLEVARFLGFTERNSTSWGREEGDEKDEIFTGSHWRSPVDVLLSSGFIGRRQGGTFKFPATSSRVYPHRPIGY